MRSLFASAVAALSINTIAISQALAWNINTPAEAVPEFDGTGAIAAIGLLAGIAALIYQRARR